MCPLGLRPQPVGCVRRSDAGAEGDGLAVDRDGVAVRGRRAERGGCRGAEQRGGAGQCGGAVGGERCCPVRAPAVEPSEAPSAAVRRDRGHATGCAGIEHVAVGGRARIGGRAAQVGGRRTGDRGGDVRLGGIADRGLQRLVGDRLGGVDQLLQRGDAGIGRLQHLHTVVDAIEQVADVARPVVQPLRGEEVGGIVERRVDLLAGRQPLLRRGQQVGRRLQRQQVLANGRRENDVGHWRVLPLEPGTNWPRGLESGLLSSLRGCPLKYG